MDLAILFFWVFFAALVGVAAGARGRSGVGWFLLALILSPLLMIILVLVLPNLAERARQTAMVAQAGDPITPETHARCPDCREWVRRDALVCKHCRRTLEPETMGSTEVTPEPYRPPSKAAQATGKVLGRLVGKALK